MVKDIVENRSRNVMILWLAEANNVMRTCTLKHRKCLSRKMEDSRSRPVKVTMDIPVVVSELLKKSRDLKIVQTMVQKPDQTVEQRRKHCELVNKLKQNIKDSPDKPFR